MEERQYDKAMRLIASASKNIADLGDLLKSPREDNLTEEEQTLLSQLLQKVKDRSAEKFEEERNA